MSPRRARARCRSPTAPPCSLCSPNPRTTRWRDDILCAYYGGEFLYTQRIAITDRFKYVFNGFDFDEMYDLERDPDEMHNQAENPAFMEQAGEMRERLYRMMASYGDPYGPPAERSYSGEGQPPDRYGAQRYLARG